MFYTPDAGHNLPHNPFSAIVSPRPIGWISSRSKDGVDNLAPYSFFNAVAYEPPQVMFASTSAKPDQDGTKDTMNNIRETGVFCVNIVAYDMRDAMNKSAAPADKSVDEFALAEVASETCETINCLRVAKAPAALECKLTKIVAIEGTANLVAFGQVTGVHLQDDLIVDGHLDVTRYHPLARLGYQDYTKIETLFSLERPTS